MRAVCIVFDVAFRTAYADRAGRGLERVVRVGALRMLHDEARLAGVDHELRVRDVGLTERRKLNLRIRAHQHLRTVRHRQLRERRRAGDGVVLVRKVDGRIECDRLLRCVGLLIEDVALLILSSLGAPARANAPAAIVPASATAAMDAMRTFIGRRLTPRRGRHLAGTLPEGG